MRQPVSLAARRAFWPSLPMARDSWKSGTTTRAARVIVPDYQLSLAIGKEGQNARLAAKLTGWRIDIRPDTETTEISQNSEAAGSHGSQDSRRSQR